MYIYVIWLGKDERGRPVVKPVTKGIPLDPRTDVREGRGGMRRARAMCMSARCTLGSCLPAM